MVQAKTWNVLYLLLSAIWYFPIYFTASSHSHQLNFVPTFLVLVLYSFSVIYSCYEKNHSNLVIVVVEEFEISLVDLFVQLSLARGVDRPEWSECRIWLGVGGQSALQLLQLGNYSSGWRTWHGRLRCNARLWQVEWFLLRRQEIVYLRKEKQ